MIEPLRQKYSPPTEDASDANIFGPDENEETLVDQEENMDNNEDDDIEDEVPDVDGTDMGDLEFGMHQIRRGRKHWPHLNMSQKTLYGLGEA